MARLSLRLIQLLALSASLTLPLTAQNSTPQQPQLAVTQPSQNQADQPGYTLRTYSRLVNLELVVKDSKGNHIDGLKASDFQIEEQTPAKSGKTYPQKIAEFREVHMADKASQMPSPPQIPQGVYTNALTLQQDPVPPTVLLVDGLNTAVGVQAQAHVQMLKMLRQLPPNVPVAVFLLGDRLTLLQSFTSNPKLLQDALSKAVSAANVGMANKDPRGDAGSAANMTSVAAAGDPHAADVIASIANFDMRIYSSTMDERVLRTINALTSLGENLSGYPGRKNLLWLSTSFPISLSTSLAVGAPVGGGKAPGSDQWTETRGYSQQLKHLTSVLSDARIAVYPVDLGGVDTSPDVILQSAAYDTMHEVADGTGGIVCTGDNDLGDCVRKAVDDSSDFYEVSYYSDSQDWKGDFRKIAVKTAVHGARLEYRAGYYANPEGSPDPKLRSAQLQSDCDDYLDATSITFTAKSLPSDSSDELKFSLAIDPAAVTFSPTADGGRQLNLDVAVCTYNQKDWALKLMSYPVNLKLTAQQYSGLVTTGKLTDTIRVPGPKPAAIRLLVKDISTGKLGTVYIKTAELSPQGSR